MTPDEMLQELLALGRAHHETVMTLCAQRDALVDAVREVGHKASIEAMIDVGRRTRKLIGEPARGRC